jgi:hypothetical protein
MGQSCTPWWATVISSDGASRLSHPRAADARKGEPYYLCRMCARVANVGSWVTQVRSGAGDEARTRDPYLGKVGF